MPPFDIQEMIGDDSYVHCMLVFRAEMALRSLGVKPFAQLNYHRMDTGASPPHIALRGVLGRPPLKGQLEKDYGVVVERLSWA